jgi:hypothetical protein
VPTEVIISGGRNLIKKEATKIPKYKDPQQKYSARRMKKTELISVINRGN